MVDGPNLPQPPSDDEISERLRRAVERASGAQDGEDPFTALHRELHEAQLPEVSEPDRPALPEDDPEFAARLARLEKRVDKVQAAKVEKARVEAKERRTTYDNAQGLNVGMTIAYMFLGFPVIGVLVGWAAARFLGFSLGIPVFGFVGILVGCVLAFQSLSKAGKDREGGS